MLTNIQILRGVAAYLVVFVHLVELNPDSILLNSIARISFGGVDLFFVISGFIMVHTTARRPSEPIEFMVNRFKRIFPLYCSFTLLAFAVALISPTTLKSTTPDLFQLFKSLTFIPFEKSPGRIYPTYYLGWTLNYEMFFYSIFAASMAISYAKRVLFTSAAIIVLSLSSVLLTVEGNIIAYFYTRPIMLDFVLGMLIAANVGHLKSVAGRYPGLPWLTLGAGLLGLLTLPALFPGAPSAYAPPTDTFLRFGLPSALIVIGAIGLEGSASRSGRLTLMREIGDASYSIYLSHFLVVGAAVAVANELRLGTAERLIMSLLTLAVIGLCGILLYRFFEKPIGIVLGRWPVRLDGITPAAGRVIRSSR